MSYVPQVEDPKAGPPVGYRYALMNSRGTFLDWFKTEEEAFKVYHAILAESP